MSDHSSVPHALDPAIVAAISSAVQQAMQSEHRQPQINNQGSIAHEPHSISLECVVQVIHDNKLCQGTPSILNTRHKNTGLWINVRLLDGTTFCCRVGQCLLPQGMTSAGFIHHFIRPSTPPMVEDSSHVNSATSIERRTTAHQPLSPSSIRTRHLPPLTPATSLPLRRQREPISPSFSWLYIPLIAAAEAKTKGVTIRSPLAFSLETAINAVTPRVFHLAVNFLAEQWTIPFITTSIHWEGGYLTADQQQVLIDPVSHTPVIQDLLMKASEHQALTASLASTPANPTHQRGDGSDGQDIEEDTYY